MFDLRTSLLLWAAEALTLSALLAIVWLYSRRSTAFLHWAAGFALHGLGVTGVAMRGHIPDFLSIEIANTAALFGMGMWLAGLRTYDRRPFSYAIFIPASIWIAGMLVPSLGADVWARVVLYHGAAALGYGLLAAALHDRSGKSAGALPRRLLSALYVAQALGALVVALLSLTFRPATLDTIPGASLLIIMGVLGVVASLLLGARLLMLETEDRLTQLALTDPLTGALNRRGLFGVFARLSAENLPARPLMALIQFDLDHFKRINDRHGHQAGDAALVAFSHIVRDALPEGGVFGRLGGEEFVCLLRVRHPDEAVRLAELIRTRLKGHALDSGTERLTMTVSAGIGVSPAAGADADRLLSAADGALYAAKRAGRDRIALDGENGAVPVPDEDAEDTAEPTDDGIDRQVAALRRIGGIAPQ